MSHGAPAPADGAFAFGENWARFLATVDERRVASAEVALRELLGATSLQGRTFFDVGSGSGLSSVAARRLGARVSAFDVDAESVACTRELARRFCPDDPMLTVAHLSILDDEQVARLGTADVVHAWGVLHHTGDMARAIGNACRLVAPGGRLVLALYNDQGLRSRIWSAVKRAHQALPAPLRPAYVALLAAVFETKALVAAALRGRLRERLRRFRRGGESSARGMSWWHDWRDWVGGWPFEVARPESVIASLSARGFELTFRRDDGGWGCNEMVFARPDGG
jgi:SAM-dependent methyltransferase